MIRLLLTNHQAPGDILMLTAAVRDLHAAFPGRYQTAVQTSAPELWDNNPHVTPLHELAKPYRAIQCGYPLVQQSNHAAMHFIHGFAQHLGWRLGVSIPIRRFAADIHLSDEERRSRSPVEANGPYWIIVAGGKYDFTTKWWDPAAYQAVVNQFAGRLTFVQCGQEGHWHPPLDGVISMVGKTSIREFVRLMHHADGVVCPVTFAMHLAAAVPLRPGQLSRPCIVIAGGREPPTWEMYPGHQFLHTVGALDCCAGGGCWKSRCQRVGDGDTKDQDLCVQPVRVSPHLHIARCMTMVKPGRVIDAIELHLCGERAALRK